MNSEPKRRLVAIVGRPNVGKSAIFNRLVGRRIAIVHSESGVTRDRLLQHAVWDEQPYELVDTGGLSTTPDEQVTDPIASGIHYQAHAAIQDSAIALLVVDASQGLHPMDEEVAGLLRRKGLPAVVAVNKCDAEQHEAALADFARLGFPVFPVSALHNRGFAPLMSRVLEALPAIQEAATKPPLRVAVVGRPNVGKSSFINRLLGDNRVIVSNVPGTTRDRVEIPFTIDIPGAVIHGDNNVPAVTTRSYLLVDTAGMRRKGRIGEAVERYSHFRSEDSIREADVVVLMLDAVQGPTEQDKHIAAAIQKYDKGCLVIVNKWDLAEGIRPREYVASLCKDLPFIAYCPMLCVSSTTGFNVRHSITMIDKVAASIRASIPTGLLNRVLGEAVKRVAPSQSGGKRLKLFYATQVGTAPVRIRIFCNDPKRIRPNYREYLARFFRQKFDLEGAPLVLQFRNRHDADPKHQVLPGKPINL